MRLINTIELDPFSYASEHYETPKGSFKELPEEWDDFWKKCLADKNLEHISAIRKGSFLVNILSISDDELEKIIKHDLEDINLKNYEEEVSKLMGGMVLQIEDNFIIEPTCCADIGNILEWEEIFETNTENWKQLWIGHPWIFYKKENRIVQFSDYYEKKSVEISQIEILTEVPENELKTEFELIKTRYLEFQRRIYKILEKT